MGSEAPNTSADPPTKSRVNAILSNLLAGTAVLLETTFRCPHRIRTSHNDSEMFLNHLGQLRDVRRDPPRLIFGD